MWDFLFPMPKESCYFLELRIGSFKHTSNVDDAPKNYRKCQQYVPCLSCDLSFSLFLVIFKTNPPLQQPHLLDCN